MNGTYYDAYTRKHGPSLRLTQEMGPTVAQQIEGLRWAMNGQFHPEPRRPRVRLTLDDLLRADCPLWVDLH